MTALYLHIPFCRSKCHYCSFSSCAGGEALYGSYVDALIMELTRLAEQHGATATEGLGTLFLGGGTPTCLPVELLQRVIRSSLDLFGAVPGAEISVEANPGTVERRYFETLLAAGVNRLSLGVQSFEDQELALIGRIHNRQEACSAIEAARVAGFTNISLDLMFGLPGQIPASWRNSLAKALSFNPQHLSLYQLTIEPDTRFDVFMQNHTISLPAEDDIVAMDDITAELCSAAGLRLYETSNYAAEGYQCRHNVNYWLNNDYLAAGAAAVSCRRGVRERRIADPGEYIRRINRQESVVVETEHLAREESFRETVIMGLRMVQGVSRSTLYARYGMEISEYYGVILKKLLDPGFVELTATHLRITAKGWPIANQIMAKLV